MASIRICFIGDSITLGTGDAAMLGWPGRLGKLASSQGHDITVYNLGIRGDTTEDIRRRWQVEAAGRLPPGMNCALVFAFGLNDCVEEDGIGQRVKLEHTLSNAESILREARAWLPSLLVGPLPVDDSRMPPQTVPGRRFHVCNSATMNTNHCLSALMRELQVPYLDLFSRMLGDPKWHQALAAGDSVHPSQEGHELVAQAVWNWTPWRQLLGLDAR